MKVFCEETTTKIKKRDNDKADVAMDENGEVFPASERCEKLESQNEEKAGEGKGASETPKDTRTSLPMDENWMECLQRESLDFLSADDELEEEEHLLDDWKLASTI